MAGAYSNPYGALTSVNVPGPSQRERQAGKKASSQANIMRLLSGAAPMVGSVAGMGIGGLAAGLATGGMGAPAGAALGGTIGGGIGSALGGMGNMAADETVRPYEEADLSRRRKLDHVERLLRGM